MSTNLKLYAYMALGLMAPLLPGKAALAETHYDIVKDFNVKSNPNGVWTYMDSAPLAYHHHRFEGASGVDVWSNDGPNGSIGAIARNKTGQTITLKHGRETFPAEDLFVAVQDDNPGVIISFQAPVSGVYNLKGSFVGLAEKPPHRHGLIITYYGSGKQSQLYFKLAQYLKTKAFKASVTMAQGDTITFLVTRNPTRKPDGIGLAAEIVGP